MDTNLGNLGITQTQYLNATYSLVSGKVLGFGKIDSDVIVVSAEEFTDPEKEALINSLKAIPDAPSTALSISLFSTNNFLTGLESILGTLSNFALRLEGGNISRFCDAKNFSGLKQYLQILIANNIATQDDYTKINAIAKQQGVDLDTL